VSSSPPYRVDPADPRSPSAEVWARLSPSERQQVLDELPSEIDLGPPEGDPHRIPKERGLEALEAFFRRTGRRVYLSSELPVYYPGERVIAPDLIAVLDVEPGERKHWTVAHEGKGLDFALEVMFEGSQKKDLEDNVLRFARLGIPEYFVFDRRRRRLHGWRLAPRARSYEPIIPQQGHWPSEVLGLSLAVEGDRFRFFAGSAVLPESRELVDRANGLVDELQGRLDSVEEQLALERQLRESEQQARELAEARLRELEKELDELRSGKRR
jgi:Uma2 family endonuclease